VLPALTLVAGGQIASPPDSSSSIPGALRLVADLASHCGRQVLCRLWSDLCLSGAGVVAGGGGGATDPQGSGGVGGGAGGDVVWMRAGILSQGCIGVQPYRIQSTTSQLQETSAGGWKDTS